MAGKVFRCGRSPPGGDLGGRSHQADRLPVNGAGHQIGIGERSEMAPERDVEAFLDEIDETVGDMELDLQFG